MMLNTVVKDVKKINSLIWFRNDLRVHDHSGLFHAIQNSSKVIGVFCFSKEKYELNDLGFPRTDSFRAKFLIESVNCLKDELKKINITLLVAIEKPEKLIEYAFNKCSIEGTIISFSNVQQLSFLN